MTMPRTPEDLVQWAERLLAAALDREAYKQPGWHADAQTFLAEIKAARRRAELNDFAREFGHGWDWGAEGPAPGVLALLFGDADLISCVYRALGASAGITSSSRAPELHHEHEALYALAAGLLSVMGEVGVRDMEHDRTGIMARMTDDAADAARPL